MKNIYSGKVAVITGAAGVICSQIARDLAGRGAFVVLIDLMLENYGGVGIESARWMAEVWEEYLPIYDHVHGLTEGYKKEHARCEELRDVWATFEQGYYLVVLEQELDEEVIAKDEITSVDVDE